MTQFLGHFHPLLVHLPTGILLFAILLQWLSRNKKHAALQPAIRPALFCGMLGAVASVITGLLLSQNGEYAASALNAHKWLGIAVALTSSFFYFWKRKAPSNKKQNFLAGFLFVLLTSTGHLGGTLTHGEGYLTQHLPFRNWVGEHETARHISDVEEAQVYQDVVVPVLQAKCYVCHGPEKQKGGLRMDVAAEFQKGGKDGAVFIAGRPEASEMLDRISLNLSDDDHMPPEGKPQLTENEIALLRWWIATGASFDQKIKELPKTNEIKSVLASLPLQGSAEKFKSEIPAEKVEPAEALVLQKLRDGGVLVLPLAQGSNYLEASFINADSANDRTIKWLAPLAQQLVSLNLSGTAITDSAGVTLAKLTQLRKLHLQHTGITAAGVRQLQTLAQLQYLNLVGTKVTAESIATLSGLKNLQQLYLYQTSIDAAGLAQLREVFPKAMIEAGGYMVATFLTDTTEVKPPKVP
ncbi:MAG: hypothetical protein ALAOOOJD_03567 [bacterium]|nr:hypothetical protein [bacterium]